MEETRGYQWKGSLWSPGYFRADARPGSGLAHRLGRTVGHGRRALAGRPRAAPKPSAAAGCSRIADAPPKRHLRAELVLAADQFIITPAGRVEEAARARAAGDEVRTVIAGYHWFTDWGRDTMISLEGLTLSTRPAARGRLHPAHLRALRARRPDPEHVSRRRSAKGSTTPPTRRCGSSTRSTLLARDRRHGDAAHAAADARATSSQHHLQGTRFGIGVDPADGLLRAGRRGLPADVDGREGRRLGGDAAARQGGRDQRALVQRALPAARAGRASTAAATGRPRRRTRATRARVVQPALLVRAGRLSLRRRRRRAAATTRRAARTRCSRSRCRTRCSTRRAGSR